MENNKKELGQSAISIGKRLKEAREKKLLSIGQIQKQTKIHSTVLIALEEGRASEILTDIYVRSFLKKYAQFLGLNSNEVLKEYFPPQHEISSSNISVHEKVLPKEVAVPPKLLYITGMAILAVILVLLVVFLGGKIFSYLKKPKVRQQRAVSAALGKKKLERAKSATKKKSATKTRATSKELIPQSAPLILEIRVKEPVLVKLKKDGILIFERVMPKDLVENVTANDNIELDISRSQALELTLNGRPIVLPTKKVMFGLEITRKGVRIR